MIANPPDTSFFIGREKFLQELRTTLLREQRAMIAGMSGVGKTAVAWEYVQHFAQHYQFVCRMDMATDETLLADLFATMQQLSLPIDLAQGIAGLFQTLQRHLLTQQNFLLILDNLPESFRTQNDPEQQHIGGHLLLITRALHTPPEISRLDLAGLEPREGALLLLRQAGLLAVDAELDQAEEDLRLAALELARELHGLPIALNLAGGYLRGSGWSMRDYLFAFRDCSTRLSLPPGPEGDDMQEIAVACELSLTQLEQARPDAFKRLQVSAVLLPEAIPASLFEPTNEPLAEEATVQLENLHALLLAGLLTADSDAATVSTRPLIQDLVRQFSALDQPQLQVEQALQLFQQIIPSLAAEPLPARLRIAGHIRHLATLSAAWPLFSEAAAEVFCWAASLLWEQGLINTAEPLLRRALVIWERALGDAHPGVANVLGNLATLNSLLKNYAEAEALSHRAIASKSTALGVNHPDVLLALDHLGHVYTAQGKQQEARLCYEKVLSIGERVGLRHHAVYTAARYDLALLYIEQEEFNRAERLLRKVCLVWGQRLDPRDPAIMVARFNLAEVYVRLKNWRQAETYYRQALPVCEQLLGREHPVALDHMERAASVFVQTGEFAEARLLLQQVLEVRERNRSDQQLAIANCQNVLARIALAQEQLPEALALLEQAQSISASQPTLDPLVQAALLDTQASIERVQQHHEEALAVYQRALELRKQALGEEHPDLAENLGNLALLYRVLGQPQEAETLLSRVLALYRNAQKPEDQTLDPVLKSLAEIEISRKRTPSAKMYLERLRAIRELAFGQADPRTAEIVQMLAELASTPEPSPDGE